MTKRFLSYGKQSIGADDIRAVVRVLKSDWITQGPEIARFEEAFARDCGAPYAVAVSSGTAGLHLACMAAGFGPGDEVCVTPMTFIASANAVVYTGAKPLFVDIDDRTVGLDPGQLQRACGRGVKGIVNVHFAGQPSVIGPKERYSSRADFTVIEDACHAPGAEVREGKAWHRIGSCRESDMTVFSFHPVKHLTTGEGGMVTTRRRDLYQKLKLLRSHGIEREAQKIQDAAHRAQPWYYEMTELGFNYRLTDIQCALGHSQLQKLGRFVRRRRQIAAAYTRAFRGLKHLTPPAEIAGTRSSFHLYPLRIDFEALRRTRESLMADWKAQGIGTQVHYIPVTNHPFYRRKYGFRPGGFPVAEKFYERELSIPIYPAMTDADVRRVIAAVRKTFASKKG